MALVDRPELDASTGVPAAWAPVVVVVDAVVPVPVLVGEDDDSDDGGGVEDGVSVDWKTIRTPNALIPSGLVMAKGTVEVLSSALDPVYEIVVPLPSGAIQVQNRLAHLPPSVEGVTHAKLISPLNGQHVTVVMLATPVVSWHALQ